ncbi:MAG: WecB/TagA/CpsF family glycosyltransferase [Pseudomonadales bacterium]|nr:WecB/TagA/CpsF family glycosyltransferase [Pseudomonadales bacterium]
MSILGADFDALGFEETVERCVRWIEEGRSGWLSTVNVAILMMMRGDPALRRFVTRSAFVVADGQPLVWCAPLFGGRIPERVAGVDLVLALSREAATRGLRVGLLGAQDSVVQAVAARLRAECPGLELSCVEDGYFDAREAPARADAIREAGTDLLFVGMGVPRQEQFIEGQWDRLGVRLAIGVGGTFDVLAGLRSRAPALVQRLGLEWAYRLAQEPRRLWKRYLVTNSRFLLLVARQALRRLAGR